MDTITFLNGETPEQKAENYPAIQNLVRSYFHQDYDVYGTTPDDVIRDYKSENTVARVQQLSSEIRSFMARYPSNDAQLSAALERVFAPEDTFYNYGGRTTTQGLLKILELLG